MKGLMNFFQLINIFNTKYNFIYRIILFNKTNARINDIYFFILRSSLTSLINLDNFKSFKLSKFESISRKNTDLACISMFIDERSNISVSKNDLSKIL